MKQRHLDILEILSQDKRIEVNKLAERIGVSEVTIRKDLTELEKDDFLIREHGFAVLNESEDINKRISRNYHQKQAIVEEAVKLIQDGETIMVESGSCCSMFVKALAEQNKEITVITNSVFIADYIRKYTNIKTILLGGEYQKEAQVLVGPITRDTLRSFYVDKAFVGTDGYSPESGFTGSNYMRADVVKSMIEQAENTIILTDSSKFDRKSLTVIDSGENIATVITDSGISDESKESLLEKGVELIIV